MKQTLLFWFDPWQLQHAFPYPLPQVKTGRNKKIMADFLDPFSVSLYRLSLSSCDVWNHQLGAATLHAHKV